MRIKIERSGGISGIQISNEIDSKNLPSSLENTIKKIMLTQKDSVLSMKSSPKGKADYYTYKISIQDGANRKVIECNQFSIREDLKLIVKYVERNMTE